MKIEQPRVQPVTPTAPVNERPKATWFCPKCGTDRLAAPCPNSYTTCPMVAIAHGDNWYEP